MHYTWLSEKKKWLFLKTADLETSGTKKFYLWRLHLNDQLNAIDVQAASSYIRGHQDVKLAVPERLEGCLHRNRRHQCLCNLGGKQCSRICSRPSDLALPRAPQLQAAKRSLTCHAAGCGATPSCHMPRHLNSGICRDYTVDCSMQGAGAHVFAKALHQPIAVAEAQSGMVP